MIIMDKKIKNLLFDLGGVIVDIERQRCVDAFAALGLRDAGSYFGDYGQQGIFKALEEGSAGVDEFHRTLHAVLPPTVTDNDIDEAFQRFIIGVPLHRLETLRRLRGEGYKLYLLSNTNPVMWRGVLAREFTKEGMCREDYFDGIVTSFEARALKPDARIFEYAARTLGIRPEETLFFDDSLENVEAARACGYNAVEVRPGTEFVDKLPR